jgi:hypothetical protein
MKTEFIPYEQALALKELGFDEPCLAFYNGKFLDSTQYDFDNCSMKDIGQCLLAPTYSQAFRWFRDNHDKYGVVNIDLSNNLKDKIFVYMVEDKLGYIIDRSEEYNTYEEAELACLNKLIEIVKNGKQ